DIDALGELNLVTAAGNVSPLRSIAHLANGGEAIERHRENLRQLVPVSAHLEDRDLGSVMADLRAKVQREVPLPPGVTLEYGGLYASQQQAFEELVLVFAGAAACLGTLLLIEFGSPAAVVAILACSTLSLTGS